MLAARALSREKIEDRFYDASKYLANRVNNAKIRGYDWWELYTRLIAREGPAVQLPRNSIIGVISRRFDHCFLTERVSYGRRESAG